jgi:hypothetical protein
LTLALVSALAQGCTATTGAVEVVQVGVNAATESPRRARYAQDVTAIAAAFESALALPPVEVPLVLFPNRRAFATGLIERGYTPELAEIASGFDAIGGASAVLVNAQIVDRYERRRRIRLLAHELVHSMQYRWGGGTRGASEQWLREGFAEWVACRVAAHLRAGDFDELRDEALAPLSAVQPGTAPAPLEGLSTFPQWATAQRRSGGRLYAQAFLGAELLIDTSGTAALAEYFTRFATGTERRQAFSDSFGMDLAAFESVLQQRWHQAILQRQGR